MVVLGAMSGVACSLVGCYLVLRRMSMLGDAISHAVLPGLVIAFLFTGHIGGWAMVLGALAMGLLTSFLTATVREATGVPEDAGMGVVFTTLFALGVVLLNLAPHADLDADCVFQGQLAVSALPTVRLFGVWVPPAVFTLAPVLLIVVVALIVAYKEVKLVAFDPALATALGLPVLLVHQGMLGLVAGVTVASFEAVGSILVVAMLIVPPVTAQLLTERLPWMLVLAALVAVVSAVLGVLLAGLWSTSAPGMMAVVAGAQLALAWLFAPRGLLARWWREWSLSVRIAAEDVLARLYRAEQGTPVEPLPTGLTAWLAVRQLRGLGELEPSEMRLTVEGRARAESLVRAHRLWEAYLHSELSLPADHLHDPAEAMEHFLDEKIQAKLSEALDAPERDPHGRPIPKG
jgi:ABC-type Mn2+/Zn2+ transport system permease subunit